MREAQVQTMARLNFEDLKLWSPWSYSNLLYIFGNLKSFSIWTREVKRVAVCSVYDMLSGIPIGLLQKIANDVYLYFRECTYDRCKEFREASKMKWIMIADVACDLKLRNPAIKYRVTQPLQSKITHLLGTIQILRKHSEWVGWFSQMLMLYAKPVHFTNKVCLQGGWVSLEIIWKILT